MSRVYKCSKFKIELYIPNCDNVSEIDKLSISLYTDEPELSADFIDGFDFHGNIVSFIVPAEALCNLHDGVLRYTVQGYKGEDFFVIERQSNYFLKSPSEYGKCDLNPINETLNVNEDNIMIITPEDYNAIGFSTVKIDANDFAREKYNEGYNQALSEGGCPELEEIYIHENGVYEGAYNKVNVNVAGGEGGECKIGDLHVEWDSNWNEKNFYAADDGYNGYGYIHINANNAFKTIKEETKNKIVDNLQVITINSNNKGYITPPSTLYGDIKSNNVIETININNNSCIEIAFRDLIGGSLISNNTYINDDEILNSFSLLKRDDNNLDFRWGKYKGLIHYDNSKLNTIVLKFYDTENPVIVNDSTDNIFGSFEEIQGYVDGNLYLSSNDSPGEFLFKSLKIWNHYDSYNAGEEPDYILEPYRYGQKGLVAKTKDGTTTYPGSITDDSAKVENVSINNFEGWKQINVEADGYLLREDLYYLFMVENQQEFDHFASEAEECQTSEGVMYFRNDGPVFRYKSSDFMIGNMHPPGTSLIKPWVYKEGNSLGDCKILPKYWIGGFNCYSIMYIENIFEEANYLEYMEELNGLGVSFSTIQTLDFSQSSLNDRAGWFMAEPTFSKLADTVYDFSQGPNQYGIEYAEVKFGGNFIEQESKDKWIAKGWRVVE